MPEIDATPAAMPNNDLPARVAALPKDGKEALELLRQGQFIDLPTKRLFDFFRWVETQPKPVRTNVEMNYKPGRSLLKPFGY